MILKLDFGNIY